MGQLSCIKMFVSHTTIREPGRFSYLLMVTQQVSDQQGLETIQVERKPKCFGSDKIVQQKVVGPKMRGAA